MIHQVRSDKVTTLRDEVRLELQSFYERISTLIESFFAHRTPSPSSPPPPLSLPPPETGKNANPAPGPPSPPRPSSPPSADTA